MLDFEPETTFQIPALYPGELPLTLAIAKTGGGTPGRRYDGLWRTVLTLGKTEIYRGGDLNTPIPHTHHEAARALATMLTQDLDQSTGDRLDAWTNDT
jgi:hypothetical protein